MLYGDKPIEHKCWYLVCSCGELIGGCEHALTPPVDMKASQYTKLTRTRGCVRCKSEAQYVAFDKSYKPLTQAQLKKVNKEQTEMVAGHYQVADGQRIPIKTTTRNQ
jgi:hypothetical protein